MGDEARRAPRRTHRRPEPQYAGGFLIHDTRQVPDKLWYLRRLNLFEGMTETEVEQVSRELKMRHCAPRQPVLESGSDRVYLVKEGRIRLFHLLEDGQEVTTAMLRPGQLFGLGALFGGDESATNAEAVEPSLICEAGAQDFLSMLARHPLLMAKVVMVMARQIFQLEQAIETIASQTVRSRLAGLLLSMDSESRNGSPAERSLPAISQEQMAKSISTSRESVSRTLARWQRDGLIGRRGRRIVVLRPDQLRRIAETH
jgi:CRP-like cAMP-binding protein